jgi:iron complex transport system substrate-binding protein
MSLNASPPASAPRSISPVVFAVAVLVVGGLAVAGTAVYFELTPKTTAATGASVTDDLGHTTTVVTNPHRVAVFGPNIVDSMVRLGLRSDIVGVDCSSAAFGGLLGDYTPNQTAAWTLTSSLCIQAYPAVSPEALLNKSPQLILATSIVSQSQIESFSVSYHVPVVWLIPTTLGGIVVDLDILAKLFPAAAAAPTLIGEVQRALAQASSFDTNLSNNPNATYPRVLLTYYVDPAAGYFTYGPGTFGDSLLTLAGGLNIAANASVPFPTLAGSTVLAAQPNVVVYGVGPLGEPLSAYAQAPNWATISATKVPLDVTLFTEADPTMVLTGLTALTHALHPQGT